VNDFSKKIANEIQCRMCHGGNYIGIDLMDDDGKVYAHGHLNLDTAKQFQEFFGEMVKVLDARTRTSKALELAVGNRRKS
jgi:hypothetical protein